MVATQAFNPNTWEAEVVGSEFKGSLIYRGVPEHLRLHREALSSKKWNLKVGVMAIAFNPSN